MSRQTTVFASSPLLVTSTNPFPTMKSYHALRSSRVIRPAYFILTSVRPRARNSPSQSVSLAPPAPVSYVKFHAPSLPFHEIVIP